MTRVAVVADAHVANHRRWGGPTAGGLNVRGWECVATLARAARYAQAEGCRALVVLGDLFDATRPSPPLVYETLRALTQAEGGVPLRVVIVLGNHDRQSQHDVDHACAVAALVPGVCVVTQPSLVDVGDAQLLCVPYQPGRAEQWLPVAVAELAGQCAGTRARLVMTHLGIWDDHTAPYLKGARDAVSLGAVREVLRRHDLGGLYAGNWHQARRWYDPRAGHAPVVIPGTICPHNFSDPYGFGRMGVIDLASGVAAYRDVVVESPAFETADLSRLEQLVATREHRPVGAQVPHDRALHGPPPRLYLRVIVPTDQVDAAVKLRAEVEAAALPVVVHVEVDGDQARASARDAARRAQVSDDAALAEEFAADVAAPGTPAGVLARLATYRKGAA